MTTTTYDYQDDDATLEAYIAYNDDKKAKKPAVLVVHDWSGKNEFACRKADKLAELGYFGFALDMFGKGKLGKTKEEKQTLMKPFISDRAKLRKRILAAFNAVSAMPQVDKDNIGVMGFCFGGLCALDLARSGANLKATVSFHGLLNPPEGLSKHIIKSKVLVMHGFDDPMVTTDQLIPFGHEMTGAKADWEMIIYGNAMHAFTNPDAHDPNFGTVYNRLADERSWIAMKEFFKECFGR